MSPRKTNPEVRGDVPPAIVAGIIVFLIAVFAPMAVVTPGLPESLAPMSYLRDPIIAYHAHAPRSSVPAFVDQSFDTLGRAAQRRDPVELARAQREFAAMVIDATTGDEQSRARVREHQLHRFLEAIERDDHADPIVSIAARHRLIGRLATPGADRAIVLAWFDLRWEALASREALRGEPLPLDRLMARLPAVERRAAVAWAVGATCDALLGSEPTVSAGAMPLQQCAAVRNEFIGLARLIEPTYPVDDARAAVDAMLGSDLESAASREPPGENRDALVTLARDAFTRAHSVYAALADQQPTRLLRRYLRGTLDHAGL